MAEWAEREGIRQVGLLASRPVTRMGEWSPYRSLAAPSAVDTPPDPDAVHELILAIKRGGGADPARSSRLFQLCRGFESEYILLACTELPLVAPAVPGTTLIDVTDIVTDDLVKRWLERRRPSR